MKFANFTVGASEQSDPLRRQSRGRPNLKKEMQLVPRGGLRKWFRWAWIYFLYWSGLTYWARTKIKASGGVIVLTFHRVLSDLELSPKRSPMGMIVRQQTFHELIKYLEKNCQVVPLDRVFAVNGNEGKRPSFAITFDDGWKDTAAVAFPLAEQRRMPMAVFVCPGLVDRPSPFWPERVIGICRAVLANLGRKHQFAGVCRAMGLEDPFSSNGELRIGEDGLLQQLKNLPGPDLQAFLAKIDKLAAEWGDSDTADQFEATMGWQELITLQERGVTIGSHSQNHAILPRLQESDIASELAQSKRKIESVLGRQCALFAYPDGSWSPEAREEVRRQGYTHAFVNEIGVWTPGTDSWLIPRVNIWEGSVTGPSEDFSPATFEYATYWRCIRAQLRQNRTVKRLSVRKYG